MHQENNAERHWALPRIQCPPPDYILRQIRTIRELLDLEFGPFLLTIAFPLQVNTRKVERDIYDGEDGLDRRRLWTKSKL